MKIYCNTSGQITKVEDAVFVANSQGTSNYVQIYMDRNGSYDVSSIVDRVEFSFKRSDLFVIEHLLATRQADYSYKYTISDASDGILYKNGALGISAQFIKNGVSTDTIVATTTCTAHVEENYGLAEDSLGDEVVAQLRSEMADVEDAFDDFTEKFSQLSVGCQATESSTASASAMVEYSSGIPHITFYFGLKKGDKGETCLYTNGVAQQLEVPSVNETINLGRLQMSRTPIANEYAFLMLKVSNDYYFATAQCLGLHEDSSSQYDFNIKAITRINGHDGEDGEDGNGVQSITKTSTSGLVDTYTITFTNGNTTTFNITNGANGQTGATGEPFSIKKQYSSISAMESDYSGTDVQKGQFVAIITSDTSAEDYGKIYMKGNTQWQFMVDMSVQGLQGIQGQSALTLSVVLTYDTEPENYYTNKNNFNRVPVLNDNIIFLTKIGGVSYINQGYVNNFDTPNNLVYIYVVSKTSLKGERGENGTNGINGTNGTNGVDGKDALVYSKIYTSNSIESAVSLDTHYFSRTPDLNDIIVFYYKCGTKTYLAYGRAGASAYGQTYVSNVEVNEVFDTSIVPSTYIKNASVSGTQLTLTKQDDTTIQFTGGGGEKTIAERIADAITRHPAFNGVYLSTLNGATKSDYNDYITALRQVWNNPTSAEDRYVPYSANAMALMVHSGTNPYFNFTFVIVETNQRVKLNTQSTTMLLDLQPLFVDFTHSDEFELVNQSTSQYYYENVLRIKKAIPKITTLCTDDLVGNLEHSGVLEVSTDEPIMYNLSELGWKTMDTLNTNGTYVSFAYTDTQTGNVYYCMGMGVKYNNNDVIVLASSVVIERGIHFVIDGDGDIAVYYPD